MNRTPLSNRRPAGGRFPASRSDGKESARRDRRGILRTNACPAERIPPRPLPAILVLLLCLASPFAGPRARAEEGFLFGVASDYATSGKCFRIELASPWNVEEAVAQVGSDPIVRAWRNRIVVVNRLLADDIQILAPDSGFATIREFSVGPGSNPQDIVFVDDDKAYVSRYESTLLYEVNPAEGTVVDSIDLSLFADADGLPEMARMVLFEGRLFVQMQRLDRSVWTPVSPAYLAVVDVATNEIVDCDETEPGVQGIALAASNPNGPMTLDEDAGRIYVGETGAYGVFDGGIEVIDAATLASEGIAVPESTLSGDLGVFAVSGGRGYAAVSGNWFFTSRIVSFDLGTGALVDTNYVTAGFIPDIEWDTTTGQVFVADRDITNPGVHILDAASGARLTDAPLFTGLPPTDLVVFRGRAPISPAGDPPAAGPLTWAVPNPSSGTTWLLFRLPDGSLSEVLLYDVRGRLVRVLAGRTTPEPGVPAFEWDGKDDAGRTAPPGVYFYRGDGADGKTRGGRVVIVR